MEGCLSLVYLICRYQCGGFLQETVFLFSLLNLANHLRVRGWGGGLLEALHLDGHPTGLSRGAISRGPVHTLVEREGLHHLHSGSHDASLTGSTLSTWTPNLPRMPLMEWTWDECLESFD